MEKTKWGISAALVSMLCYFTGFMSFTACIVLFVAVLVWSESYTAKINATQAVVLSVFFTLITTVCNWLSQTYVGFVNETFGILSTWWDFNSVREWILRVDFMDGIANFIRFIEFIVMFVLVIMSLKNKEIKLPVVSKLVKNHFAEEETTSVQEETVEKKTVKKTTRSTTKKTTKVADESKTE